MALFSSSNPGIRVKVLPRFPARVLGGDGITVTKANGVYDFDLDYTGFASVDLGTADLTELKLAFWDIDLEAFRTATVQELIDEIPGGGGGGGNVTGPASSIDGELVLFNGTDGETIKAGGVVVSAFVKTLLDDVDASTGRATLAAAASATTITAGAGLTGGGDLSANRTVTVGAGTGIAVNADDVALAAIDDDRVMANVSGASAAPTPTTVTALLDALVGSARGTLAMRGASTWDPLAPGSNDQFLKSQGTGADLVYATLTGGGDMLAANNLSDVVTPATAFTNIKQAATESATGVVEMATTAEAETGTDTSRAVTAAGVKAAIVGKHTVGAAAGSLFPATANGCAPLAQAETTTNKINYKYLAFDASAAELAWCAIPTPKSYNASTLTARVVWTHPSTTTNFAVVWAIELFAAANDDALDTALGTVVTVTDTGGTTQDFYTSDVFAAITPSNTPAKQDWLFARVSRQAADGADTMAVDAHLIGVEFYYTTDAMTDD